MANAIYNKDLPAGVGEIVIWDGTNLDEVVTLVGGIANVYFHLGYLTVNEEQIEVGDAVAMTDDETPVAHAKISKAWLMENAFRIEAVVYDETNLNDVIALVGLEHIAFRGSVLYVGDTVVADGDAVATSGGSMLPVIPAALLASDYTVES